MTELTAFVTEEGQNNAQDEKLNGKYIDIIGFGISETKTINLDDQKTIENINALWCRLLISGTLNQSPTVQQLNLTIPANVTDLNGNLLTTNKNISELYLFARKFPKLFTVDLANNELIIDSVQYNSFITGDNIVMSHSEGGSLPSSSPENFIPLKSYFVIKRGTNRIRLALTKSNALNDISITIADVGSGDLFISKAFLFIVGQFNPDPLVYPLNTEVTLRTELILENFEIPKNLKFIYTQAQEINDHNIDPNAHPQFQKELKNHGIFVNDFDFRYNGQAIFKDPIFDSSVIDFDIVYMDSTGVFKQALGTTGTQTKFVGVADVTNKVVRKAQGFIYQGHSYNINTDIYLSNTNAGKITNNVTAYKLGKSLGNGITDFSSSGSSSSVNYINDLLDVLNSTPQENHILKHNGTIYENSYLYLDDIFNISAETPNHGDTLNYDNNSGVWVASKLNIENLLNFNFTSLDSNETIMYTGSEWINKFLGVQVGTNQSVNSIQFGAGFNLTDNGNEVTVDFTGGGSASFLGLSDTENSFPNNSGIVIFDYSETDPDKIKIANPFSNTHDNLFLGNSVFAFAIQKSIPYVQDLGAGITNGIEVMARTKSGNLIQDVGWLEPSIKVDVNNGTDEYVKFISFATGFTGNITDGILTLNSTGGGLSQIQNASLSFGNRPLVFDGSTGKIRNLHSGNNITIDFYNSSGNLVGNINDAVTYQINSKASVYNRSHGSGAYPVAFEYNNGVGAKGLKAGTGISITQSLGGSNQENLVISFTGSTSSNFISSVNTNQFSVNSGNLNLSEQIIHDRLNLNSVGLNNLLLRSNHVKNTSAGYAIYIEGLSNGGFHRGISIGDTNFEGLWLRNTCGNHMYLQPISSPNSYTYTTGIISYFTAGAVGFSSPEGLYVRLGGFWRPIALQGLQYS